MKGLTILEVLIVALISGALVASFFYILDTGQVSNSVTSASMDLQSEVRRALDWISRDARETVNWDIANISNSPTDSHIKFRKRGWNYVNNTPQFSSNYTEYSFDTNTYTITRRLSDASNNTIGTWKFYNITQPPFYTLDTSNNTVALNNDDLLKSGKLVIRIRGQRPAKGQLNVTANLSEEVKIRNNE